MQENHIHSKANINQNLYDLLLNVHENVLDFVNNNLNSRGGRRQGEINKKITPKHKKKKTNCVVKILSDILCG